MSGSHFLNTYLQARTIFYQMIARLWGDLIVPATYTNCYWHRCRANACDILKDKPQCTWLDLLKLPSKQLLQAILATPHITKSPKINTLFHWEEPSKKLRAPA